MDFNQKQYEQFGEQYLDSNQHGDIGGGTPRYRVHLLKQYLPPGRKVLEIGAGGGLDALVLKEFGYDVIASDYTEKFVNTLKRKGLKAIHFDAKNDELPEPVDCIYANAVFVHFSPDELSSFLHKIKKHLQNEKIIFLSVIKGLGYERTSRSRGFERDFYYYTVDFLKFAFEKEEYKILEVRDDYIKWIQMIAAAK